ncbi:substrate-binding domain-containing protein, partial [Microbacterium sp. GXF7504]
FLGGGSSVRDQHVETARVKGYRDAMTEAGLAEEIRQLPAQLSMPDGYAAAVDLLSDARHRPTAVVAACDEVAIGAMVAARRLGIQVPSGLSIIGIDDHEYADMFALTTMQQVPREQGVHAVDLLVQQIEDPDAPAVDVIIKPRLIVRSSTAPIGRGAVPRIDGVA